MRASASAPKSKTSSVDMKFEARTQTRSNIVLWTFPASPHRGMVRRGSRRQHGLWDSTVQSLYQINHDQEVLEGREYQEPVGARRWGRGRRPLGPFSAPRY